MDKIVLSVSILVFFSWGVSAFIAKIAANRIGTQSVFWDLLGYVPVILIYSLVFFKTKNIINQFQADKLGTGLAILAGAIGSLACVGFYYLMTRADASTVTPLTALYPALTAILAFIILHESITTAKILGIILSLVAIYLLAK